MENENLEIVVEFWIFPNFSHFFWKKVLITYTFDTQRHPLGTGLLYGYSIKNVGCPKDADNFINMYRFINISFLLFIDIGKRSRHTAAA